MRGLIRLNANEADDAAKLKYESREKTFMKNNLLRYAILAFLMCAVGLTNIAAQDEETNGNVVTFSKIKAKDDYDHAETSTDQFRCGDSIYAQADFEEPVSAADGYTVSILFDEELVVQEKMNGAGKGTKMSIGVDLLPNDASRVDYPTATIIYADALLRKLDAGTHHVQVAVSVGADHDTIAVGEFQFDTRRGCEAQFARVKRRLDADIARMQKPQQQQQPSKPTAQPAQNGRVKFVNKCDETRSFSFWYEGQFHYGRIVSANSEETTDLRVGTKIFMNTAGGEKHVYTVQPGAGEDGWGQQVATCQ